MMIRKIWSGHGVRVPVFPANRGLVKRRGSNPRPSEPQPNVRYSQVFTTAKPYEQDGNCPCLFPPVCFSPPPIGVSTGVLNISLPFGQRSSTRPDVTRSIRSSQRKVRHPTGKIDSQRKPEEERSE